jgi:AAA15 family ATPase/GTPase
MYLKKIQLINFKRFDDLTIDLGDKPKKIVALVGPNGCGKSSIFDAFEEKLKDVKGGSSQEQPSFFSKIWHAVTGRSETYSRADSIKVLKEDGTDTFDRKSVYIRSAYRFTPKLKTDSIKAQPDILEDSSRPGSSIAVDSRLQGNYERLLGIVLKEFQDGNKTGTQVKQELIGKINAILKEILEIQITDLGDVTTNRGQLFFEKETSKDFPFENLSSGEKEVVDIIIDLIIKTPEFNDTVYCIDEPELHLNTAIQRKLLIEIDKLLPENCQLWVATHSIGFLRALQEELKDKCQVLDFSEKDYFNRSQTIIPVKTTRQNWQRIFQTALEDLTGLMAPGSIVYCEGAPQPAAGGAEQGLDAIIYNQIFEDEYDHALFVSSGGGDAEKNASIALKILSKAFASAKLFLLKDKDDRSGQQRQDWLDGSTDNRMLKRRELENYLFDESVLQSYCADKGIVFEAATYGGLVTDIQNQDLKPVQQQIQHLCNHHGDIVNFKIELANHVRQGTATYNELKSCIDPI